MKFVEIYHCSSFTSKLHVQTFRLSETRFLHITF